MEVNRIDNIENLNDIYKYDYELYIRGGGHREDDFRKAKWPSVKAKLWQEQLSKDQAKFRPRTNDQVMNNFVDGPAKSAAIIDEQNLHYWISNNPEKGCHLKKVKNYICNISVI